MVDESSPLSTRACAAHVGFTSEWIRKAIVDGVDIGDRRVRLEAETVTVNGRRRHRIYRDRFRTFLTAIGWKRLPALAGELQVAHV
jgi:hypothetical protein